MISKRIQKCLAFTLALAPSITFAETLQQSNAGSVKDLAITIANFLVGLTGALSVLFIIVGGLQYITSAGNEERMETAKRTLLYAIIGLIAVVLALVILKLVNNTLRGFF